MVNKDLHEFRKLGEGSLSTSGYYKMNTACTSEKDYISERVYIRDDENHIDSLNLFGIGINILIDVRHS